MWQRGEREKSEWLSASQCVVCIFVTLVSNSLCWVEIARAIYKTLLLSPTSIRIPVFFRKQQLVGVTTNLGVRSNRCFQSQQCKQNVSHALNSETQSNLLFIFFFSLFLLFFFSTIFWFLSFIPSSYFPQSSSLIILEHIFRFLFHWSFNAKKQIKIVHRRIDRRERKKERKEKKRYCDG